MASRADQLGLNLNLAKFGQATDLKKRLWFTLGALIIFRLLSFVPLPGIDPVTMAQAYQSRAAGGVLDLFNTFSGGSLSRASIIALGIMPHITASIVVQLAAALSPTLAAIKKEGEAGRKKLNQYTRYGTVLLTIIQGYVLATQLQTAPDASAIIPVINPGPMFIVTAVISLIGGTLFLMWLGEQITSRGIGNGVSLIILAGIVSSLPQTFAQLFEKGRTGDMGGLMIVSLLLGAFAVIWIISYVERAQRRVLVQYPKRQTQQGMAQQERSHLPLKVNTAGVIPPIFASSLLLLPLTITQFMGQSVNDETTWGKTLLTLNQMFAHGKPLYMTLYALGIIFFAFFYVSVVFNPEETADSLKKQGGFIPGYRPGKSTADYLDYVLTRITVVGALYLALVCLVPESVMASTGIGMALGGTSLLILVNVTIDTVTQIQSHLLAHQYADLVKKANLKGNKGKPRLR